MKEPKTFLISLLSFLSVLAVLLLGNIIIGLVGRFPPKETYYYIPEAKLYLKKEGISIRFSEDLGLLKANKFYDSISLRLENDMYRSTIYFPHENQKLCRIYVDDPHNCLMPEISKDPIIWLAQTNECIAIPSGLAIELPIKKGNLYYQTSDCSKHLAVLLDKDTVKKVRKKVFCKKGDFNPLGLLHSDISPTSIDDACIRAERTIMNTVTLYIRDNMLECEEVSPETPGRYPFFYYNTSYPDFLFCGGEPTITSRDCHNIHLITYSYIEKLIKEDGANNWYCIILNPFQVKKMK